MDQRFLISPILECMNNSLLLKSLKKSTSYALVGSALKDLVFSLMSVYKRG